MATLSTPQADKVGENENGKQCPWRPSMLFRVTSNPYCPWTSSQSKNVAKLFGGLAMWGLFHKVLQKVLQMKEIEPVWTKRILEIVHSSFQACYGFNVLFWQGHWESGCAWDSSFMLYEFTQHPNIFQLSEDMIHHWTTLLSSHVPFMLQDGKLPKDSVERRRLHGVIFICLFGADPWKDLARVASRTGHPRLSKKLYDLHMFLYFIGRVLMWPGLWFYNYFCVPGEGVKNHLKLTPNCAVGSIVLFSLNFLWFSSEECVIAIKNNTALEKTN